jgi:tetratricopeptide (TPR) repeat protein
LLELGTATDISKVPNFEGVSLRAAEDVKANIKENPLDYLPYLYLSRVYSTLGSTSSKSPYNDMALEQSMKALEISPTFVRTYYEIAQVYLNKADYASAYEWFKKAAELQPEVGVSYWYLGSVRYAMAGDGGDPAILRDAAKYMTMAINKGYAISEKDGQKLLSIYFGLNDMQNAAQVLEFLMRNFPQKIEYASSAATVYARLGMNQEAIAAARKVIELAGSDQKAIQEAQQFIRNLGGRP